MKLQNIGNYKNVDAFVEGKLAALSKLPRSFKSMFDLMFMEESNIMYEKSVGYKMVKTTYKDAKNQAINRAVVLKGMLEAYPFDSTVGLYMNNSLDWILNFWAILLSGYKPLLLNLRLDKDTLEKALSDVSAVCVISEKETFSCQTILNEEFLAVSEKENENNLTACGSELFVMSSGTSSHLKICAYSAEEFYYQILDSAKIIKDCTRMKKHYEGELKQLCFLPFYHIFGLVAVYIWFAFFSRTFVHLQDLSPQTILNTIRRHKVTHIFAVPLFWEQVYSSAVREIENRGEKTWKKFQKGLSISKKLGDFPVFSSLFTRLAFREVREGLFGDSIIFMITGGSAIRKEVMEFFNAIGYHLSDGYGMSEIGITSVELSDKKKYLNEMSVGFPMSSIEYRISEDKELLVRGKAVAKYVLEDGKKTSAKEDWFNTHDLAREENGRYFILGRKDDLVISASGENLNPNLIEPKLLLHNVENVCLLSGKDREAVLLVSVSKYLNKDSFETLKKELMERLDNLKLRGQITKVSYTALPLLTGEEFKLNRRRLRREYLEGKYDRELFTRETGRDDFDDPLYQKVKEMMSKILNRDMDLIHGDEDFFQDYSGTSLDYFALASELQNEFNVALPEANDKTLSTLKEIYEYIKERL